MTSSIVIVLNDRLQMRNKDFIDLIFFRLQTHKKLRNAAKVSIDNFVNTRVKDKVDYYTIIGKSLETFIVVVSSLLASIISLK